MKMRTHKSSTAMFLLAWLCATAAAAGADPLLPIKTGTYVREEVDCSAAPNAAILEYTGTALFGAHSQDCVSSLVSTDRSTYRVQQTCPAIPDHGSAAYRTTDTLIVRSPTRFVMEHATGAGRIDTSTYRLCPFFK